MVSAGALETTTGGREDGGWVKKMSAEDGDEGTAVRLANLVRRWGIRKGDKRRAMRGERVRSRVGNCRGASGRDGSGVTGLGRTGVREGNGGVAGRNCGATGMGRVEFMG